MSGAVAAGRRWIQWRGFRVSSYKVALYVGTVAGIYVGAAAYAADGGDPGRFAWGVVALMVPALAGSRAWFVLHHRDRFAGGAGTLDRSAGGAGLFGGLGLALAVSPAVLAAMDLEFAAFWDAAALTMLVGLVITRVGCHLNGCCAGRPTRRAIGRVLPDVSGTWLRRWPTQLLEAVWGVAVLAATAASGPLLGVPGSRFVFVVTLYCAGRALLEATRADSWAPRALVRVVDRVG